MPQRPSEDSVYRALFDAVADPLVATDATGHVLACNPAAQDFLGRAPATLLGTSPLDWSPATQGDGRSSRDAFEAILASVLAGTGACFEWRVLRSDGAQLDVEVSARAARGTTEPSVIWALRDLRDSLALRASESRFRSLFERVEHVSVQGYDRERRVIFWNAASEALYGYTREEALGRQLEELIIPPAMRDHVVEAVRQWVAAGIPIPSGELTLMRKGGTPVSVYSSHTMQVNSAGEHELYCLDIDLSARKEAEARMREALVVFNASSQAIMVTDAEGVITAVNPAFCAITGYGADEVMGRRSSMFKPGRHDTGLLDAVRSALQTGDAWEGEIWNRRKNGELYPQWLTLSVVRDEAGRIVQYVSLFSDITERKQQEEAMWRQANFDVLTGLANRSLLHDRLERSMAQARRNGRKVGLMFIDLDGFKWINDTLGHDVGDELLVEVARRLQRCVRDQDTVARQGGDEFALVLHDLANPEDMLAVGEKVVALLREPYALSGTVHHLSGSVGITVFPDDGEDVQTLLRNADIAMYKAKQGGRNRFRFYARHMQADALARMSLEADLRQAMEQRGFTLHYQPIVDSTSGALVGAEALLRWRHPQRGMVSPQEFIPLAEDRGLIVAIGEWALHEAARQWQAWRMRGLPPLRMAVNVSGVQFREADLRELVARVLDEYGMEPGSLMLEITESVLMDASLGAEAHMHHIRARGVAFALDDFGTGFSSLSYLKRFPVDIVKIDRSFVRDCPQMASDARLVEAIINMAHGLGLTVTAEGVETEAQLALLRALGCDRVQGYLLGRPVPADAFEILLERGTALPGA